MIIYVSFMRAQGALTPRKSQVVGNSLVYKLTWEPRPFLTFDLTVTLIFKPGILEILITGFSFSPVLHHLVAQEILQFVPLPTNHISVNRMLNSKEAHMVLSYLHGRRILDSIYVLLELSIKLSRCISNYLCILYIDTP